LIQLDKYKNATYEICEPVAWDNIGFYDNLKKPVSEADLIIYGSLASRNEATRKTLFEILEMSEATRLLDVNLRPPFDKQEIIEQLLHLSDFVKLNNFELEKIAAWHNKSGKLPILTEWLSEFYQCADVCVTRGANGALFFTGNKLYEHRGFKVNTIDTVGAGDAFLASLVFHLSQFHSPGKSLEYACATGAFVATQKGAVPHYSVSDIEKIIKSASF
jgi:fructokinase